MRRTRRTVAPTTSAGGAFLLWPNLFGGARRPHDALPELHSPTAPRAHGPTGRPPRPRPAPHNGRAYRRRWLLCKRNEREAVVECQPIDYISELAAAGTQAAVLKFWRKRGADGSAEESLAGPPPTNHSADSIPSRLSGLSGGSTPPLPRSVRPSFNRARTVGVNMHSSLGKVPTQPPLTMVDFVDSLETDSLGDLLSASGTESRGPLAQGPHG